MFKRILFLLSLTLFLGAAVFAQGTSTSTTNTAASTSEAPKKPPVFRPNKDQITQVQTILKEKKLYTGEASGSYNDETRSGIKSFQKDNGLKETGTLNRATLEKFGVELTDKQKLIPVSPNSFASTDDDKASAKKPATTAKSDAATAAAGDEKPKKAAPFRATPDQIKAAQKLLKSKSMYTGDETGKLDDATRDGLRKYQDSNGVKVTGTLNAVTLEKMGIELTEKQKGVPAPAATTTPVATPKN